MSLINDALKQTKQSQPQIPPVNPPTLSPVESAVPGAGSWLAPVMIILLLAAAGIFIGLSLSKHAPPFPSTPLMAANDHATSGNRRGCPEGGDQSPTGYECGSGGCIPVARAEAARHFVRRHTTLCHRERQNGVCWRSNK